VGVSKGTLVSVVVMVMVVIVVVFGILLRTGIRWSGDGTRETGTGTGAVVVDRDDASLPARAALLP
jgi:hypothetical protein